MKSLIIVDIQPFYHQYHKNITPELLKFLNERGKQYENILWFFNAEEVGIDETIIDMKEYIEDFGILGGEIYGDITFIDKYYAFFRNWMDTGVEVGFIVKVIQHMIREDVNDSRDLDEEDLIMLIETYYGMSMKKFEETYSDEYDNIVGDNIHIPHFKWEKINELKNVDICGGGRNECLAEMEILLEAVGVDVNKIERFIYG
jgi:hypothetical protein